VIDSLTTRTRMSYCPKCGYKFDSATSFEGEAPKAGDISICFECVALLVFNPDLTLHAITDAELAEFKREAPKQYRQMEKLRQGVESFSRACAAWANQKRKVAKN
jgi:hypothetical protein